MESNLTPPKGASPNTVVGTGPAGRRHLREAAFKKTLVWVTGLVLNSHYTEPFRGFQCRNFLMVESSNNLSFGRAKRSFEKAKCASARGSKACGRRAAASIWIEIGARSGSEALNVEDIRQTTQTTLSIKLSLDTNDQKWTIELDQPWKNSGPLAHMSFFLIKSRVHGIKIFFDALIYNHQKHPLYQSKYHIKIWKHS